MTVSEPVVVGVRHHSPTCARLVRDTIVALRPAHVLIEGPADVNDRIEEFHLGHQLPVALYSYLSTPDVHRASWTPFAEHSPEWQAMLAGREVGARVRFIDLPAWHEAFADLDHRYGDAADDEEERQARAYTEAVAARVGVDDGDVLWDHLFESQTRVDEIGPRLDQWFDALRGDTPGSLGNVAREEQMARWIAWATGTCEGPVLVVCGGFHAPALRRRWREVEAVAPPTPLPPDHDRDEVRFGSFLVPYSFKRLDSFTGYASGMPSPAYYQWLWESGPEQAGLRLLEEVRNRLRARNLPASTATVQAVHTHAHGLARLRGHDTPLRVDWCDAMAAGWVSEALDAPLPWTYRGPIRPGTDPVLVEVMGAASGDATGRLAPGTPLPPLVEAVADELAACELPVAGTVRLDLLDGAADRERSRVLHRLRILRIPGVERVAGPALTLGGADDSWTETWRLADSPRRLGALIEAGAWGGTLVEAARARWSDDVTSRGGDVAALARALDQAVWAGLTSVAAPVLATLRERVRAERDLGALGEALRVLAPLARRPEAVGAVSLPAVVETVDAIVDRAVWLFEPAAAVPAAEVDRHLGAVVGLRDAVLLIRADRAVGLTVPPDRIVAVLSRKALDGTAAPVSRGAALGALISLDAPVAADPLSLLDALGAARLGDALAGLLALAREVLVSDPRFVAGLDRLVTAFEDAEFVGALPSLRGAFAWLPPRERGDLAGQVLGLHDGEGLSTRVLTAPARFDPVATAAAADVERQVVAELRRWGVWRNGDEH
ncbi:MAG: DUF5682 family protein [Aeromicrobium sp.]|uniref:DUF5682 family protein n=1 Tax=Aeromicrobium sp. TaxID=1871063 RepID=UPI0039E270FD